MTTTLTASHSPVTLHFPVTLGLDPRASQFLERAVIASIRENIGSSPTTTTDEVRL